jgi:PAS domain S-box-containing protein
MSEQPTASDPLEHRSAADIFERITDAVFALDAEWQFTYLNERAAQLLDREPDELLGEVIWEAFPEAVGSTFQRQYERAMETQEPVTFEEYYPPLSAWFEVHAYPSETGLSVYFRDVTEQINSENELQERERALRRAYEVIADPEKRFEEKIDDLLEVVRKAVGTEYGTLSRVQDEDYVFEAVAAPADAALEAGDTVALEATNCSRVVASERTLVLRDVEEDAPELADRAGNADWGISCYLGAPVTVDGEVYGTFCFYDMEARAEAFSDWEVTFVDLLSNWVSYELERKRRADRLTAVNELHGVVRDVTGEVVNRSTREEIERATCERLAASESYTFAWIAETDPTTESVVSRVEAGIEDFLENIRLSADPDEPVGRGPAGEAFRTGEIQVSRDVFDDPAFEPWRENAETYGFRSFAAIPIVHEESSYGVIGVYSERAGAFAEAEREVVGQLGEILGQAISAVERKRALTSDSVVELELRIRDAFAETGGSEALDGTIVHDEVVPVDGDEFLLYGTASGAALSALAEMVERKPHWSELTRIGQRADGVAFELRLSESPLLSTVASLGGNVERAVIDDGDYVVTVHLHPGADIRRVVETVRDSFPDAEVISQRQVTRPDDPEQGIEDALADELTDRQLETLRLAYFSGFFRWPRDSTGEEVAEEMDVSAATFHQHLRTAEEKIFDVLLDDRET